MLHCSNPSPVLTLPPQQYSYTFNFDLKIFYAHAKFPATTVTLKKYAYILCLVLKYTYVFVPEHKVQTTEQKRKWTIFVFGASWEYKEKRHPCIYLVVVVSSHRAYSL